MSKRKRLHVITWGCQMNVYDSGRMADVLAPRGYDPTTDPGDADVVILNTCHIRDRAAEKVFSELGRLRRLRTEREASGAGRMLIAVTGCVAQAEGDTLLARAPFVDIVCGPQTYHRLPDMIERALNSGASVVDTEFPAEPKFDFLPAPAPGEAPISAFLTVQEGCDKFCSFCVVPYTRGAEMSRPASSVLDEARRLVEDGAREIVLLGQNVNAWHGRSPDGATSWSLGRLLRALAEIPGVIRLRYTTSHPGDMDEDLIAAHADVPALAPFLHLPVQSGSNRILSSMNRRHTADDYRALIDRLRSARPDIALSSDFIVGYPGETVDDFAETLRLVRDVGFAQAYSFKYSPRPGTRAATAPDQVPEPEKDARLQALQALLRDQQTAHNAATLGAVVPVLFTGAGRHAGQVGGRTPHQQAVHVSGPLELIGTEAQVLIDHAYANSLSGTLIPSQERAPA